MVGVAGVNFGPETFAKLCLPTLYFFFWVYVTLICINVVVALVKVGHPSTSQSTHAKSRAAFCW